MSAGCASCGYDLSGLAAPGICPECATPFDTHAAGDRISEPWPCLRCGYPLIDHRRLDPCAECGFPARFSLRSTLLRFQPGSYRKRVRIGALLVCLGMLGVFLGPIVAAIVGFAFFGRTMQSVLGYAALCLSIGCVVLGWLRVLGAPPETLGFTVWQERYRVWARIALFVTVIVGVVSTVLTNWIVWGPAQSGLDTLLQILAYATVGVVALASAVFFFASTVWVMALFARALSAKRRPGAAAVVALVVGILVTPCYLVLLVVSSSMPTYPSNSMWADWLLAYAGIGVGLGSPVLFFCWLFMADRLRVAVKRVDHEVAGVRKRSRLARAEPDGSGAGAGSVRYAGP